MWIIIQGIPLTTNQQELQQFLSQRLKCGSWFGLPFKRRSGLKSVSILKMTDRLTGEVECHGLAELDTLTPNEETLRSLNGHPFRGRRVTIRKYYHRSSKPAQKVRGSQPVQPERRRPDLHIEMLRNKPIDALLNRR
ncbi:hypothetical protein [Sedimenticola sp.]|uniref:hypothetical protein n=1 Tax=Sedimenticola sp. TaxID=1940285 RepID=UPI003D10966D